MTLFEYISLKERIDNNTATPEERRRFQTIEAQLSRHAPAGVPLKQYIKEKLTRLDA